MTESLLRVLLGVTVGLVAVLVLRRPARRIFGAGAAFTLWLLPVVSVLAPLLPGKVASMAMAALPGFWVSPDAATALASGSMPFDWPQACIAMWLAGAVVALLRLGVHYVRLLGGLRGAPAAWTRALEQACPGFDIRRLREHAAGPAVLWALPRSLVLLPADFAERFDNEATLELVLRHEITHARRGDAWWSLAMEVASALLWFHPLAWLARPRFRLDQELACDAASLRASPESTAGYARALVDSVATQPAPALIPWLAEPQLKERIAMISRVQAGALRRRAGFLAVAALLAGCVFVVGGQTPVTAATAADARTMPPAVDVTFKNRNPPKYPIDAVKKGEQGNVLLNITVDAKGAIKDIAVDPKGTTAPQALQIAAIRAAQYWRFQPGSDHGEPVGGVIQVPINFSLHESNPCHAGEAYASALDKCVKLQFDGASS